MAEVLYYTIVEKNNNELTLTKFQDEQEEVLHIDTAETTEHIEVYLKAIWTNWERKQEVKVSSIVKLLNICSHQPYRCFAIEPRKFLVEYKRGKNIVELTSEVTKSANK
jgi:hypothetical protein